MKEKIFYMAYGSNLNLEQMARLCKDAEIVGGAILKNHYLLFRGENGGAFLNIHEKKGCEIPVLIWRVSREDETSLDAFEEYPYVYHKEVREVMVNNQLIKAMAYVMNEGFPLGQPSETYYKTVLDGYRTANYDVRILENARVASFDKY